MLPLGSIAGVRIGARISLLLVVAPAVAMFGLAGGGTAVVVLLASVLAHELGHAIVAVRCGVRVAGVELGALGGRVAMVSSAESQHHELVIAAAGPAASALIATIVAIVAWLTSSTPLALVAAGNGALFATNALPLLPLDGGRALRSWLTLRVGRLRATRAVAWVNRLVGLALITASLMALIAFDLRGLAALAFVLGVALWAAAALEVRRAERELARAQIAKTLLFDPLDAPWARR